MQLSLLAIVAVVVSTVLAGVVITPIFADQVVEKASNDCFFGVTTPSGCGPLRKTRKTAA
ncbi:hypothetical protein CMQ_5272 [Grosmannia clavigera kw1407]|uniref:Uncharacterized protein n=1 Tax=Grosmannia clavigera (strain kw1407 / UAMH 11150) TaxID=655863 RepID=F0XB30_GROCL|nr:uncharacterized protein CMQ_5272 [Grosmannia clavigera kw1407]EFX05010.1 hypothetical protein CMQ_5272 [Grosmannia clavigera kw1407]